MGMGIALITPFKKDGSVDFDALERLVEYQIENGTDYLVILGTTAETPTLTEEEKDEIARVVIAKTNKRLPIVMGIGGNNTRTVVEKIKSTDLSQVDAVLSVVPYYNKPSQEGIYQHYKAIAQATSTPIVLYNVPGRTGVNAVGAVGVISVIGNAFPREFSRMVRLAMRGDLAGAREIHYRFTELMELLFVDGNPAGVKSMLSMMGFIENELRLPLVPTTLKTTERMR